MIEVRTKAFSAGLRMASAVAGWLIGAAFASWAGVFAIVPLVLVAAAFFALKKLLPEDESNAPAMIAVPAGHWAWMALGAFLPGGFEAVAIDVIGMGGLLLWLGLSRRPAAAYALIAWQALGLAANLFQLSGASAEMDFKASCFHIVLRLVSIYLAALYILHRRRASIAAPSAS